MKGENQKVKWAHIAELMKSGALDELQILYPDVFVRYYSTARRITGDYMISPSRLDHMENYWVYGPPGTGKSYWCREEAPDAYLKNLNRWWCGYANEEDVIIEEIDAKGMALLARHIKKWADIYPFRGEIKNGSIMLRPKRIFMTSNYTIEECCGDDIQLCRAVERRFIEKHMIIKYVPEN